MSFSETVSEIILSRNYQLKENSTHTQQQTVIDAVIDTVLHSGKSQSIWIEPTRETFGDITTICVDISKQIFLSVLEKDVRNNELVFIKIRMHPYCHILTAGSPPCFFTGAQTTLQYMKI
jgi:hypothetical protein